MQVKLLELSHKFSLGTYISTLADRVRYAITERARTNIPSFTCLYPVLIRVSDKCIYVDLKFDRHPCVLIVPQVPAVLPMLAIS